MRCKTFGVLAVGAVLAGLAVPAPQTRGELPPHGGTATPGSGSGRKTDPATPGSVPSKGKKLEIAFTGGVMAINGKKFTLPVDEKELIAALGPPSRSADLANKILTWDDQGLFAYIKPRTTTCHAFAITLGPEKIDFWPKKAFSGRLTVDGAELRGDSKIEEVNRQKSGKPFQPDDILNDVWSIDHKEGTLYLRRSPDPKVGFIKLELGIPSS